MTLLLCLMATSSLLDSSPIRPVSVVNEPADGAPPFTATFHKPATVGESNYTHFWMPIPMFRVALAAAAPLFTAVALHGDSGPWGHCPNPKHPQNCTAYFASADGAVWTPTEPLAGNALLRLNSSTSRGFGGRVSIDASTNTTGSINWMQWELAPTAPYEQPPRHEQQPRQQQPHPAAQLAPPPVARVTRHGTSRVVGLPPLFSTHLMVLPSSVRMASGEWLALAYGATQEAHAAGAGDRTCVGLFSWQGHFCSSVFVLSTSNGDEWAFRSELRWGRQMGTHVAGPDEAALTLLPNGLTLLAIYRVQEHEYLWQSLSADGGRTWGAAKQSNAWSVFPGVKTLQNGATVLVSGRPGIGLWLLLDASEARWQFYNLAAEHNRACEGGGCGVNATYTAFVAGIVNATTTVIGGQAYPISLDRWRDPDTPAMSKAYLGLEDLGECADVGDQGVACDVLVTYDRDCNGGEGPDCPMCRRHRVHGNVDRVYAMRVTVTAAAKTARAAPLVRAA